MLETSTIQEIHSKTDTLLKRTETMGSTTINFFDYLTQSQKLYQEFSKTLSEGLLIIEDQCPKKLEPYSPKFENIINFVMNSKRLSDFVSRTSSESLSEIYIVNVIDSKEEERTKEKAENFFNSVEQFQAEIHNYNKDYEFYDGTYVKLMEMMRKSNFTENQIYYYNTQTSVQTNKEMSKKLEQCEELEKGLVGSLELLYQKKINLKQNLKEVREKSIIFLNNVMEKIGCATKIIVNFGKDSYFRSGSFNSVEKNEFIERMAQEDLKELEIIYRGQRGDLKTKCIEYKNRLLSRTEKQISCCKKLIQQIKNEFTFLETIVNKLETIKSEKFKTNNVNEILSKFNQYCGKTTKNIVLLCFQVNENPAFIFNNIGKFVIEREKKLRRIIEENEEALKEFVKNAEAAIVDDRLLNNISISFGRDLSSSLRAGNNFKDITKTFILNQKHFDLELNDNFIQLNEFVLNESSKILLRNSLRKEQEIIQSLEDYEPQDELLQTVHKDNLYDFLLREDTLEEINPSNFRSLFKQSPEDMRIILNKKNKKSGMIGIARTGCCGIQIKKEKKEKSIFETVLVGNGNLRIEGNMEISSKGIGFLENGNSFFSNLVELWVPINEIKAFHKSEKKENNQVFEILTKIGLLKFQSHDNNELLEECLDKNILVPTIEKKNDQEKEDTNERSELSIISRHSVHYITPSSSNIKNRKKIKLKELAEKLQKTKFFSEDMIELNPIALENEYRYNGFYEFKVNEKRDFQKGNSNDIIIFFDWKVIFPDPLLKSYNYSETVIVELSEEKVEMNFNLKKKENKHLRMRSTFYNEVEKMNGIFSEFVSTLCNIHTTIVQKEHEDNNFENSQFTEITMTEIKVEERSYHKI